MSGTLTAFWYLLWYFCLEFNRQCSEKLQGCCGRGARGGGGGVRAERLYDDIHPGAKPKR